MTSTRDYTRRTTDDRAELERLRAEVEEWRKRFEEGEIRAAAFVNSGGEVANAELLVFDPGDTTGPPSAPARSIEAGRIAVFDVDAVGAGGNHVLVVSADRPVAVGIGVTAPDALAASAAVPDAA